MRPLGDGFIKLIKMLIAPIVFSTVVVGIAQMGAMKDVGRIGLRALVYFEVVSTLALVIGLVVATVMKPGSGLMINAAGRLDVQAVAAYTTASQKLTTDRLPDERHPEHGRRRLRPRRDPPGAAVLGAVRPGAARAAGARVKPLVALIEPAVARAVRHHRDADAAGADRRLRRHGVHGRPLRHRHACSRSAS